MKPTAAAGPALKVMRARPPRTTPEAMAAATLRGGGSAGSGGAGGCSRSAARAARSAGGRGADRRPAAARKERSRDAGGSGGESRSSTTSDSLLDPSWSSPAAGASAGSCGPGGTGSSRPTAGRTAVAGPSSSVHGVAAPPARSSQASSASSSQASSLRRSPAVPLAPPGRSNTHGWRSEPAAPSPPASPCPASIEGSNPPSWASQSASSSRQVGARRVAKGSERSSADEPDRTDGTSPVGGSVQCGSGGTTKPWADPWSGAASSVGGGSAPPVTRPAGCAPTIRTCPLRYPVCSRSSWSSLAICSPSDLQELPLFVAEQLIDHADLAVGQLLQFLLDPLQLVGGERALFLQALELVAGCPAEVPNRDPPLFGLVPHHLHQLPAALLGEGREGQPDHGAVVGRVDAQVRSADRPLDGAERALVVGRDDQQHRVGDAEAGQLAQRRLGPVVVDHDRLDERRRGPAGAHRGELALGVLHRLGHLLSGLLEHDLAELFGHRTSVPICSPLRARRRFPAGIRSNTLMGRPLSLQKVTAVRSITRRSLATMSMKEISSKRVALGSRRGSAL